MTTPSPTRPDRSTTAEHLSTLPPLGRLEATGFAAAYMLLAVPAIALFVVHVVAIPLTIVTVGVLMLAIVVPLVAALAEVHRRIASRILREPVRSFYKPTKGLGVLGKLQRWAGDGARWRDLGWLFVTFTFGWVISIFAVSLALAIGWYLVFPFIFWVTPDGVFDTDLGFMMLDTQSESFMYWIGAAVFFALWWTLIKPLVWLHAVVDRAILSNRTERLEQRVEALSTSRADTVDASAAELRRIERDLHDGAQARLVALGISLGMADELLRNDPEAARQMLAEARTTTTAALGDLRSVVRGIHPPVLADRGLEGAVEALAMDMPIPVLVESGLTARVPAPVESAAYFAVAEFLANIGKHSGARRAWVRMGYVDNALRVEVGDDGRGGAQVEQGTGLRGIAKRLVGVRRAARRVEP